MQNLKPGATLKTVDKEPYSVSYRSYCFANDDILIPYALQCVFSINVYYSKLTSLRF